MSEKDCCGRCAATANAAGWQPIETAPEGVRVLLGPRKAPVVGIVMRYPDGDTGKPEPSCSVVHYNGRVLVSDYRCSEWAPLAAAAPPEPLNARLLEALRQIAAIENCDFSLDWEEIEEAREIARAVLANANAAIAAAAEAQPKVAPLTCSWTQDGEGGPWVTACGGLFEINDGLPSENRMTHCCFCGQRIDEGPWTDDEDDGITAAGEKERP